jgi:hypothetical protein
MSERKVVGINPWLPWPLCDWPWWTESIRGERLAALRIGVAAVLLFDVLWNYLPLADDFFGRGSLGSPEIFAGNRAVSFRWSLLAGDPDRSWLLLALVGWAVAAAFLLFGLLPRLSAIVAWALSISFINLNFYIHNSGDNVRTIALFYLMLCPCAAVWRVRGAGPSLETPHAPRPTPHAGPVYVPAWPVRLLFVQLVLIYFVNGIYKVAGADWRDGSVMHYVLGNVAWTRFSYAQLPLPYPVIQLLTWTTLIFELFFPLLVVLRWTRIPVLWLGVSFHVGTAVLLQLCGFPLYMMCLYLPLVPWERFADGWRGSVARPSPCLVHQRVG